MHVFSHNNPTLMKPDGSLLPSSSKSSLIHELENMVADIFMSGNTEISLDEHQASPVSTSIIIDGMALVQEMSVHKATFKHANICQTSLYVPSTTNLAITVKPT